VRVIALGLVALLLPFAVVLAYFTTDTVFSYAVNVYLFDLPLLVLVVVTAPAFVRHMRARTLGLGAALWAAVVTLVVISFAFHPAIQGVQTIARTVGALAIAVAYAELRRGERGFVVGALAVAALTQSAWAVAQVARGGPLGAWWLFESQKPLQHAGDAWLPKGTMQTPYLLTALALVGGMLVTRRIVGDRRARAWSAALCAISVPVGITYSRAALGVVIAAVGVLAPRAHTDARRRLAIAALVVGVGVPGLLTLSGWTARGEQFGEERADSGRGILLLQGVTVFAMEPLTGVGPGRYMATVRTLTDDEAIRKKMLPTHAVPLLVAAESGVVAGAAVLVLVGALGLRAVRDRDDVALALYLALLPFWLLDVLPYTLPQGLLLTGLWLGALDAAHAERAA